MRHVIVRNNKVINVIEWDGTATWTSPDDCIVAQHVTASIGWDWNDGAPTDPTPPPPPPPPPIDLSDSDNLVRTLKAVLLAATRLSGKTTADAKAEFKRAWDQLG